MQKIFRYVTGSRETSSELTEVQQLLLQGWRIVSVTPLHFNMALSNTPAAEALIVVESPVPGGDYSNILPLGKGGP